MVVGVSDGLYVWDTVSARQCRRSPPASMSCDGLFLLVILNGKPTFCNPQGGYLPCSNANALLYASCVAESGKRTESESVVNAPSSETNLAPTTLALHRSRDAGLSPCRLGLSYVSSILWLHRAVLPHSTNNPASPQATMIAAANRVRERNPAPPKTATRPAFTTVLLSAAKVIARTATKASPDWFA